MVNPAGTHVLEKPVGQCPRCGVDVFDLKTWMADGRGHIGCLGSDIARLTAERDAMAVVVELARRVAKTESHGKIKYALMGDLRTALWKLDGGDLT